VLAVLSKIWPIPLPFEEAAREGAALLSQSGVCGENEGEAREALCQFLSQLYSAGVVDFRTWMPPIAREVSERPTTSPVVRWQAQHGHSVTSLFHMTVEVEDEVGRSLLAWLDGTLDRKGLLEKLWDYLKAKKALIVSNGDEAAAQRDVELNLDQNLRKLARWGLLMG